MKAVTWIGVDIAKDSCVVAQRCPEGFQTEEFPITPQGLKALGNWLPQQPRLFNVNHFFPWTTIKIPVFPGERM